MDDKSIEQEIQDKGLTAPRVLLADIEASIASEHFFNAQQGVWGAHPGFDPQPAPCEELGLVTICVLVLTNGHRIVGVNGGPVVAANFDADIGRKLARQNAFDQVWPLLGFRLRDKLSEQDVAARNKSSHDMQLNASSGITYCTRCGEVAPGTKRSCDERLAR
ncbi:hypothetical protein XCY_001864 [Xanthomonas arboricola pv. juglandis]|uniref:Gp49 family protein n=1 Tax=Xanthomonas arboricola TaxID=56448 RepID=UPI001AFBDCBD|nr:Gp49 family protein [Xanthomonas arboricola]CAG2089208.1 hypothetical protein XCY_001864 [Xanthomonas arboricola pv. juglandis]